jgi:hypothetical protein
VYDAVAAAPGQVWTIKHAHRELGFWDGTTYTVVAPEDVALVRAFSPEDVWYRIDYTYYRGNLVDGFEPVEESLPIRDLFGSGPDDVFALGDSTIEHFDGLAWTEVATTLDRSVLYTGTSGGMNSAWVGGQHGQIYHLDGELERTTPAIPEEHIERFTDVWSDGARVYAVGVGLHELDQSAATDSWDRLELGPENFFPQAIWGSSGTDIWLAGTGDRIYHFDGTTIDELVLDDPRTDADWTSIHGASPNDVWVVGAAGLARHYDGVSWNLVTTASVSTLDEVWVAPDGQAWAVGANGVVMHYTPSGSWVDVDAVTIPGIQWSGLTGSSSSDVWIASWADQIYHFDGVTWENVDFSGGQIEDMWTVASDDVWAVGQSGTVLHFDGISWNRLDVKLNDSFAGVWVSADGEGWAVGAFGRVLHRPRVLGALAAARAP